MNTGVVTGGQWNSDEVMVVYDFFFFKIFYDTYRKNKMIYKHCQYTNNHNQTLMKNGFVCKLWSTTIITILLRPIMETI